MSAYEIWGGPKDGNEFVLEDEALKDGDQVEIEDQWFQLNTETGKLEIVK